MFVCLKSLLFAKYKHSNAVIIVKINKTSPNKSKYNLYVNIVNDKKFNIFIVDKV